MPTASLRPDQAWPDGDGPRVLAASSNQAQATISAIRRDACTVSFSGSSSDPNGRSCFPKKSEDPKIARSPNDSLDTTFMEFAKGKLQRCGDLQCRPPKRYFARVSHYQM